MATQTRGETAQKRAKSGGPAKGGRTSPALFIRQIMALSPNALRENGKLIFEIWDGQSETVYHLYEYFKHFKHIEFGRDYTDTNRYVICRLRAMDPTDLDKLGKTEHLN